MRTLASTPLMLLLCVAPLACTDDGPAEAGEDATSSGDGDTGEDSTSGDGDTTSSDDTSSDDTSSGDTNSDDTSSDDTSSDDCDPWQLICDHTGGMQAAMDCGIVTENDGIAAWQAAHQCAVDAAATTTAFKVMGQSSGIDSLLSNAYGAIEGIVYGPVWLYHDSWGPYAEIRNCMSIIATPNCSVEVGKLCLECVDASAETPLCE